MRPPPQAITRERVITREHRRHLLGRDLDVQVIVHLRVGLVRARVRARVHGQEQGWGWAWD